jgi:hypothetical protein
MFRYAFCPTSSKLTCLFWPVPLEAEQQNNVVSKPRKFTDFQPRKPSNQLAKLHHNSNGPTWMKRKRVMGSDSYNPTNI